MTGFQAAWKVIYKTKTLSIMLKAFVFSYTLNTLFLLKTAVQIKI